MSKAILVIDMPNRCNDCPFVDSMRTHWNYDDFTYYCEANEYERIKEIKYGEEDKSIPKPDWCPLKMLPEKRIQDNPNGRNMYRAGWNDCIDDILGE